jgi:hypothetical protein
MRWQRRWSAVAGGQTWGDAARRTKNGRIDDERSRVCLRRHSRSGRSRYSRRRRAIAGSVLCQEAKSQLAPRPGGFPNIHLVSETPAFLVGYNFSLSLVTWAAKLGSSLTLKDAEVSKRGTRIKTPSLGVNPSFCTLIRLRAMWRESSDIMRRWSASHGCSLKLINEQCCLLVQNSCVFSKVALATISPTSTTESTQSGHDRLPHCVACGIIRSEL